VVHGDYSPTSTYVNDTVQDAFEDYFGIGGASPTGTVTQNDGVVLPAKPSLGSVRFLDAGSTVLGTAPLAAPGAIASTDWAPSGLSLWAPYDPAFPYGVEPASTALSGEFTLTANVPTGTTQIQISSGGNPSAGGVTRLSFNVAEGVTPVASSVLAEGPGSPGSINLSFGEFNFVIPVTVPDTYGPAVPYSGAADDAEHVLTFTYQNSAATGVILGPVAAQISAADAVVVVIGTGTSDSGEEADRQASIDLPRQQADLVNAAVALNPNTVVWVQSIAQVDINLFKDNVPAIFWSTYNGEYQGPTVPKTVFGDVNPSGKLAFTWYEDPVRDLPVTVDYTMTPTGSAPRGNVANPPQPRLGRTYQYFTGPVTYPFGYGLSYSDFTYSGVALDRSSATPNDTVTLSVDVKNESAVAGQEVVEVYAISPKAADALYPDKQLKAFTKVSLSAGQQRRVTIPIKASDLWFWNDAAAAREYEPGTWQLQVGGSSDLSAQGSATGGVTRPLALSGTLAPALDQVVAVADGTALNVKAPGSAIHANLSATRTDQSFIDLAGPDATVAYTTSDAAVAVVDAEGAVTPVGAGAAQITATVTAYGATKTDTFPVIVYDGSYTFTGGSNTTTIQASQLDFADATVALTAVTSVAGVQLAASVPGAATASISYTIAPMDTNTAAATVTPAGVLTAARLGVARVTALANVGGVNYSHTATITIGTIGATVLKAAIGSAEASGYSSGAYTADSAAAVQAAIDEAKALLTDPSASQAQVADAEQALADAIAALTPRGDVGPLTGLTAAAEALAADPNLTDESVAALRSAATAAQELIAAPENASEAAISVALGKLNSAIAGAKGKTPSAPDLTVVRSALSVLVTDLGALDATKYTADSYAALRLAIVAAQGVLANASATPAQITAAIQALSRAATGLTQVPATDSTPPLPKTLKSVKPKIKGTVKVGKKLSVTVGTWTAGTKLTYQWYAAGKAVKGATKSTLKLAKAQVGKKITVKVTGKKAGYTTKTVASKATVKVKK